VSVVYTHIYTRQIYHTNSIYHPSPNIGKIIIWALSISPPYTMSRKCGTC